MKFSDITLGTILYSTNDTEQFVSLCVKKIQLPFGNEHAIWKDAFLFRDIVSTSIPPDSIDGDCVANFVYCKTDDDYCLGKIIPKTDLPLYTHFPYKTPEFFDLLETLNK
jgi:hypothetical protein